MKNSMTREVYTAPEELLASIQLKYASPLTADERLIALWAYTEGMKATRCAEGADHAKLMENNARALFLAESQSTVPRVPS